MPNWITVQRFHDYDRKLHPFEIVPASANAVSEPVTMYGPHGNFICRQVWFAGGHWFFLADDDGKLLEQLKAAGYAGEDNVASNLKSK
jgi:hypothetical protein